MTRRLSVAAAAIVAATVSGAVHADGEKIAVFTKNQTNPFFQAVRLGADNAAKQMNAAGATMLSPAPPGYQLHPTAGAYRLDTRPPPSNITEPRPIPA